MRTVNYSFQKRPNIWGKPSPQKRTRSGKSKGGGPPHKKSKPVSSADSGVVTDHSYDSIGLTKEGYQKKRGFHSKKCSFQEGQNSKETIQISCYYSHGIQGIGKIKISI